MGCGIARFGQGGLKNLNKKILVSNFVPWDLKGHLETKMFNIRWF